MTNFAIREELISDLSEWLPPQIGEVIDHQTDLPRIAKDPRLTAAIED